MKYADGPVAEATIHVAAPPARIWELLSDISVVAGLSRETQEVWWLDGAGGPSVGARFAGRNFHEAAGEWTTESTVVVSDPGRAFQWDVGRPGAPTASWGYDLSPSSDGTEVRGWARMGPGPSNLTAAIERMPEKEERIVARRLAEFRTGIEATLAGVKSLAEARG
jgi:hypothetical protein